MDHGLVSVLHIRVRGGGRDSKKNGKLSGSYSKAVWIENIIFEAACQSLGHGGVLSEGGLVVGCADALLSWGG